MNKEFIEAPVSRRGMLAKSALTIGATALASSAILPALAQAQTPAAAPAPAPAAPTALSLSAGDVSIITFALTLERLESAYYSQILGAQAKRAYLSGRLLTLAQDIASTEAAHVQALETILGRANVPVPAAQNFSFPSNVFLSPVAFAWFGYTLEEIGVRAYLGAISKIQSQVVKDAAASIYGVESRHVALLRSYSGTNFSPNYYESPLNVDQVTELIKPYLA